MPGERAVAFPLRRGLRVGSVYSSYLVGFV